MKKDRKFLRSCEPALRRFYSFIDSRVRKGKFIMLDNPGAVYKVATEAIVKHLLLPNDALHYACAKSAGVDSIVTADDDFNRIKDTDLNVYTLLQ